MKRQSSYLLIAMATIGSVNAATLPIYINNTPFISPPAQTNIDARAWVNRAYFDVTTPTGLPFESLNTRFFTNTTASTGLYPAGTMVLSPGIRFFRNTNGQRLWMDTWVNNGAIYTDQRSAVFVGGFNFFVNDSRGSILQVAATNITSTGPLFSGAHGLIRLEGNNINLSRNALRTGSSALVSGTVGGGFIGFSNYVNDVGVSDIHWGEGDGDALAAARSSAMRLDGLGFRPGFTLPFPSSTLHEVITPSTLSGFLFTNLNTVPSGSLFSGTNQFGGTGISGYTAVAHTSSLDLTTRVVQVVYYPTNGTDTNFTTDVRFYDPTGGFGFFGNPASVSVGFHSTDFDIATQTTSTDSVYLTDALATTTNVFLSRNLSANTRRPSTFEVTRSMPVEYFSGDVGNTTFDTNLLFSSSFVRTSATNRYAAYAARIDLLSSSPSGSIPYDVTNVPGRIEIIGDVVNLDQTRIRAEAAVTIKANNLTSNRFAQVDAPLIKFDVRSTEPSLVISNLAPATVRRLSGAVSAWSAVWENFETLGSGTNLNTNRVIFHVLIVESFLRSQVPVAVSSFAARSTNVVIQDSLSISKSFALEGNSVHIVGGLTLPLGIDLSAASLINTRNFTNDGIISVAGSEYFGTDRALSYSNYVNRGTNSGSSHEIRTKRFENTGLLVANGGVFTVDAIDFLMIGAPLITSNYTVTNIVFLPSTGIRTNITTNTSILQMAPIISGVSDVQIYSREAAASNSIINAGTLFVSVTNRLVDSGPAATNSWNVTGGFNFSRRPAISDLLGTHIRSTAPRFGQVDHFWSGTNMGAVATGFTNNMGLGKLTLDGGDSSMFRFYGVGPSNAIYVDYLELLNTATNYNSILGVDPNLTIYFANANVEVSKLDGAAGGRIRWVPSYAGALSSTNITYFFTNGVVVTSNTFAFNIAQVSSKDLDSDGDGIVNADDTTPIYVPESAVLSVGLTSAPQQVSLSWRALAYSSNFLEFKTASSSEAWNTLTNFHMGPLTWPVLITDPIATNGQGRIYRLRVDPGPY